MKQDTVISCVIIVVYIHFMSLNINLIEYTGIHMIIWSYTMINGWAKFRCRKTDIDREYTGGFLREDSSF